MATLAHAAVLYVLVSSPGVYLPGADGAELEAISVDVVVSAVPASASSMVEATAGSVEAAEAESRELPALALLVAQPSDDGDLVAVAEPPKESKPATASAVTPDAGATNGERADARGLNAAELPQQNTAAAGAGRARQYARTVVQTLAQSKPRPKAGVRGTVRIAFSIARSGVVATAAVRKSSGAAVIDQAALEAVRAARFPMPPGELTTAQLMFEIPYIFR